MSTTEHQLYGPAALTDDESLVVSVVIPCLNEEASIERCVRKALEVLEEHGINGEVIVADNDSEDQSARLAAEAGAIVVHEPERGYGSAYMAGFAVARARYILMADADLTYDFEEIPRFVAELDAGADMVIGNRMKNIHPGAMPWLHRYVGNPLLSGFLNLLFRTGVDDAHCGMRALRRDRAPRTRPSHHRHGVRLGDGDPRRQGEAGAAPVPDRVPPAGGGVQALKLPRRLASPAVPAGPLPQPPVHLPRHGHGGRRRDRGVHRHRPPRHLRPRVGHPRAHRRGAAGHRRHPGRGPGRVRPRLCDVLHGRTRPLVRPHARPLQARTWPHARRRRSCSPASSWAR